MTNADEADAILQKALREVRVFAFEQAVELCQHIYDTGGCAMCCVEQLTKLRDMVADGQTGKDLN
jgi:hypothetical protein